jgi:hypothetical protein
MSTSVFIDMSPYAFVYTYMHTHMCIKLKAQHNALGNISQVEKRKLLSFHPKINSINISIFSFHLFSFAYF